MGIKELRIKSKIQHLASRIQHPASSIQKKSQAMLFVLFIMAVFGALAGGLAVMWESEMLTRSSGKHSLTAFYLAQAALERAKAEVVNNVALSGTSAWYSDLDIAGDNYTFRYNFSVAISGFQRSLSGSGEVLDSNNAVLAHREISVTVDGIRDTNGDGIDNNPPINSVVGWSWRET